MKRLILVLSGFSALWLTSCANQPRVAEQSKAICSFPEGSRTTTAALVDSIDRRFDCGLPWPALVRAASTPAGVQRLTAAYARARERYPEKAKAITEMENFVDAAAGNPELVLAFYDTNAAEHPNDPSLQNPACWVRGALDIDLEHAMAYCDAAVGEAKPSWALINRARVELLTKNFAAAKRDYEAGLAKVADPHGEFNVAAIYGLGVARLRSGDPNGMDDVRRAKSMLPDVAAYFVGLRDAP